MAKELKNFISFDDSWDEKMMNKKKRNWKKNAIFI